MTTEESRKATLLWMKKEGIEINDVFIQRFGKNTREGKVKFHREIQEITCSNSWCHNIFLSSNGSLRFCPSCSSLTRDLKGRGHTRMKVRMRDNFSCKDCGVQRLPRVVEEHNGKCPTLKGRIKLFDIHHLNGNCGRNSRGYDSSKDITVLITLCHSCHYKRPEHRNHSQEFKDNVRKGIKMAKDKRDLTPKS